MIMLESGVQSLKAYFSMEATEDGISNPSSYVHLLKGPVSVLFTDVGMIISFNDTQSSNTNQQIIFINMIIFAEFGMNNFLRDMQSAKANLSIKVTEYGMVISAKDEPLLKE